MLIQFSFKNYKSFKDETILDLTATRETELSFHVRQVSGEKVLPVAIIYGANASGKSNLIEALRYMGTVVLDSLNYGEESKKEKYRRPTPFLFDKRTANEPTSFEIYFTLPNDDRVFNYGFEVDEEGVTEEWFNQKARTARKYKTVFYRNRKEKELNLTGIETKHHENLKVALTSKTLLVSLGSKLNVERLKPAYIFFQNLEVANFGDPDENIFLSEMMPEDFSYDSSVRKNVLDFFSSFNDSIVDFKIESIDDDEKHYRVYTGHRMIGSKDIAYIPLDRESAGTLKMLALYPFLKSTLELGAPLFVDELNARLHPLLLRVLLQMFIDPEINKNNAQIIFTSHDTWQLHNNTFRRDEIWFTDKDDDGVSTTYSLGDFNTEEGESVRWETNFQKNYLLGKYGAIPSVKPFDFLKREGGGDGKQS